MTWPAPLRRARPLAVAAGLALTAAACGGDSTTTAGLEVSSAWARTSPMMADAGAAYMTLAADEATSIVSASVPDDLAGRVELHETVPVAGDHEMDDDQMAGGDEAMGDEEGQMGGDTAMTMQAVDRIDIPAGGEAVLAPGGIHLMLFELADPLEAGETFELILLTDAGVEIPVTVEVRDDAP